MKLIKRLTVNMYFSNRVKKVFVKEVLTSFPSVMSRRLGIGRIIPFSISINMWRKKLSYKKWVKHSLGVCYEHSSSLLLGLKSNDKCVIAKCDYDNNANFYHAWNEFEFNGEWFVYDCQNDWIYEKEHYYRVAKPHIIKTFTLNDVLNKYNKYKTMGKKKDAIHLPYELYKEEDDEIQVKHAITMNQLYYGATIQLNKDGEVLSAEVVAAEIG